MGFVTAGHATRCVDTNVDVQLSPPRLVGGDSFDVLQYYMYALLARAGGMAVMVMAPRMHPLFGMLDTLSEILTSVVLLHISGVAGLADKILVALLCCAAASHDEHPRSQHWAFVLATDAMPTVAVWFVTFQSVYGFGGLRNFPQLATLQLALTVGLACDTVGIVNSVLQHEARGMADKRATDLAYDYTAAVMRIVLAAGLVHACDAG